MVHQGLAKFFDNPAHLIIFLPVLALAVFAMVNYFSFPRYAAVQYVADTSAQPSGEVSVSMSQGKESCPASLECCSEGQYQAKNCLNGQACLGNKCEKKECPFACCDDESSRAEYKVRGCDENLLCEGNKCVQRKCWKDCCTDDPAYVTKKCPGVLECVGNKCVKPECPDKYQCCTADDISYREKKCLGNGECLGRVCHATV